MITENEVKNFLDGIRERTAVQTAHGITEYILTPPEIASALKLNHAPTASEAALLAAAIMEYVPFASVIVTSGFMAISISDHNGA